MQQNKILKELSKNKKRLKLGKEVFFIPLEKGDFKQGLPLKETLKVMKKASNENLLRKEGDATYLT